MKEKTHVSGHNFSPTRITNTTIARVYGQTRMDTFWQFRKAWVTHLLTQTPCRTEGIHRYDTARKLKEKQDSFCAKALKGEWAGESKFPDDLQWEALVDVLRGRVKVRPFVFDLCHNSRKQAIFSGPNALLRSSGLGRFRQSRNLPPSVINDYLTLRRAV